MNAATFGEKVGELKRECAAVGRDFASLDITIMGGIQGDRAKVQDGLKEFAAAGAQRFVIGLGDFTFETFDGVLKKVAGLYL